LPAISANLPPNEAFGWLWITLGLVSGVVLGLGFRGEHWLGGYASWRRRLLRLGHISFFGLGFLNVLFASSLARVRLDGDGLAAAAWAWVVGGAAMPLACGLAAWRKGLHPVFAVPVASLVLAGVLTALGLWR
jgi:hypothetical protein